MKLKIIRNASPCNVIFPPIGSGILVKYLRDKGFDIVQDDLNAQWNNRADESDIRRLLNLLGDEARFWRYIETGEDSEWQWFVESCMECTYLVNYDVILISMISGDPSCMNGLALSNFLKKKLGKKVLIGGEYFGYSPVYYVVDRVLKSGICDYYLLGYGEGPLESLLPEIIEGKIVDKGKIEGLSYIAEDGVVRSNPILLSHPVIPPEYDGLPMDIYRWTAECSPPDQKYPQLSGELTLPFHFSAGCPHNCAFCDGSGMKTLVNIDTDLAVTEMENIKNRFDCHTFFILDNTLNSKPGFTDELCDKIIQKDLDVKWMSCASFGNMTPETLQKMAQSGCVRLVWGMETGSERLLRFINKPFRLEKAEKTLKIAHEMGIFNGIEIIVGMPTETEEDFEASIRFLERNSEFLDEVHPYHYYLNDLSDMKRYPEKYNLTNVTAINRGLTYDKSSSAVVVANAFDELNGLTWKERDKVTGRRYGKLMKRLIEFDLVPMTYEHPRQPDLLAYSYKCTESKSEMLKLYRGYWEKLVLLKWNKTGWKSTTVDTLVDEIYTTKFNGKIDQEEYQVFWNEIYPDKNYRPVYSYLDYVTGLAVDSKFHDYKICTRLQKKMVHSSCELKKDVLC